MARIVRLGSARSSYGNTTPGDQNKGKEVSIQDYYVHSKGWTVIRAKDPAMREAHAYCMERACKNNDIGYSQPDRNSLRNNVKPFGFDPAKTTRPVNCDCSSLVRLCANYAGVDVRDFTTATETNYLLATGEYVQYSDADHCKSSKRLLRGDILNTLEKGHTVVVLDDGEYAEAELEYGGYAPEVKPVQTLGSRILRNGDEGADVKELQGYLIQIGYSCGKWGADGDFGDSTEIAVREFQTDSEIDVDGEYGPETHRAMLEALEAGGEGVTKPGHVLIMGGQCWARTAPSVENSKRLGIVKEGERFDYGGATSIDGWHLIVYKGQNAWVSGKYSKLEE